MQALLNDEYDVVVCGAGPAGLLCVLELQKLSTYPLRIALLDKKDPWREPVACAEAVHRDGFYKMFDPSSEWIRSPIHGVTFVSPDGTKFSSRKENWGLIIDRALMHKGLAERCAWNGADCHFRSRVKKVGPLINGVRTLEIEQENSENSDLISQKSTILIKAKYVVDACGAGSNIAQEPGLTQGRFDTEPAVFALMRGIEFDPHFIELYFGTPYAPGGYGWLFPRCDGEANVGLVVARKHLKENAPRNLMKTFTERFWPGIEYGPLHGGPIPCGQDTEALAQNQLFKAGDSASHVHPISRAGILEAMHAGKFAAHAILKLVAGEVSPAVAYQEYYNDWFNKKGKFHRQVSLVKESINQIPDVTLDKVAHKLCNIPAHKLGIGKIVFQTLLHRPQLLWNMRHYITHKE